ncbi:Early nodulin-like protein 1 [Rhynchospora pubera]|uniref:Early nodulin-like protein 1 n=1 Tax=Rhynchospora pubera TaxID=906938 RepID=A0AAV8GM37_9POAL|nr:Early nodulin-like protein 1 [Rhynchospora pubera]
MVSLSPSPGFAMANFLLLCLATSLFLFNTAVADQYTVGGPIGWTIPTEGNAAESNYNHWALRTRFHVGDSLYFKYENDSVLLVSRDDYRGCETFNPVADFTDGNTTFQFDREGFFYFISGEPGHCEAGQRMIVRVMAHPGDMSPTGAPMASPGPGSNPSSRHHSSGATFDHRVGYGAFVAAAFMVLLFA